MMGNNFATKLS